MIKLLIYLQNPCLKPNSLSYDVQVSKSCNYGGCHANVISPSQPLEWCANGGVFEHNSLSTYHTSKASRNNHLKD